MKKLVLFLSLISSVYFYSQNFSAINDVLETIERKHKKMKDASDYTVDNKTFILTEDFEDHAERHILEFDADGTLTMIELIEDKSNGKSFSNIFTGDYIRKKNAISVRANYLEGRRIARPIIYSLYLMNADKVWYLKDINNSKRWIESNNILKKEK